MKQSEYLDDLINTAHTLKRCFPKKTRYRVWRLSTKSVTLVTISPGCLATAARAASQLQNGAFFQDGTAVTLPLKFSREAAIKGRADNICQSGRWEARSWLRGTDGCRCRPKASPRSTSPGRLAISSKNSCKTPSMRWGARPALAIPIHEAAHARNMHLGGSFHEEVERLGGVAAEIMFQHADAICKRLARPSGHGCIARGHISRDLPHLSAKRPSLKAPAFPKPAHFRVWEC